MVNRVLGGIKDLKVTVTNNSDYLVDMVRVKVTYFKADGDIYKTEMLYYNHLNPRSTQTLNAPDSDRGIKVAIAQQSFTCAALDIR
jgi:serine/threonine-protein kinase